MVSRPSLCKPWFVCNYILQQANVMMLGEMLCMVAYVAYWLCGGVKNNESPEGKPNMFLFLPPALCDVTATSMMYIGLTMTSASQFQMLRGIQKCIPKNLSIYTGANNNIKE